MKIQWDRDAQLERLLNATGVEFKTTTVPFEKINRLESRHNGARLGIPITDQYVAAYMEGFRNGAIYPQLVVTPLKDGSFKIIGGNHRDEALVRLVDSGELKKQDAAIAAYVVSCDENTLSVIARSDNNRHGVPPTDEARLEHAVYMVRKLGRDVKEVAKLQLLSVERIQLRIHGDEEREWAQRQGINADRVPSTTLRTLRQLDFDEGSKLKMASLIAQHNPTGEVVQQQVQSLRVAKSDRERLAKIKAFEKALAANGRHRGKARPAATVRSFPRRDRLVALLTKMESFLESGNAGEPFRSADDLQLLTEQDRKTVQSHWLRIKVRLDSALKRKS